MTKKKWKKEAQAIDLAITALKERIDELGADGPFPRGGDVPDMYACFASNSLEGVRALVDKLRRHVLEE